MKFFKPSETDVELSETELKTKLNEFDDALLEQSYVNSKIAGEILEISLFLENNLLEGRYVPMEIRMMAHDIQDDLRDKLKTGHEVYEKIKAEQKKTETLLALREGKNSDNALQEPKSDHVTRACL